MVKFCALVALVFCGSASSATIYLCEGYSGGKFWSSVHCREKNALIDRMESVPDGLPFDQQVDMANQQRNSAQRLYQAPAQQVSPQVQQPNNRATCDAYTARIGQLDAMARQPQSAQMQDWITAERRRMRDEQFRLRC